MASRLEDVGGEHASNKIQFVADGTTQQALPLAL